MSMQPKPEPWITGYCAKHDRRYGTIYCPDCERELEEKEPRKQPPEELL